MQATIENLEKIVRNYTSRLEAVPEELYSREPGAGKWSKKEILGHLVDSAQNNIRRFIVAQYEDRPVIVYRQDAWVMLSGYRDYPITRSHIPSPFTRLRRRLPRCPIPAREEWRLRRLR